jgi:multisubunit Na+/H+ antiporter MnhE subunit
MSEFREKSTFVIAVIILLACFWLIYNGHDGEIKALIGLVVGFYFGQYLPASQGGQNGKTNST